MERNLISLMAATGAAAADRAALAFNGLTRRAAALRVSLRGMTTLSAGVMTDRVVAQHPPPVSERRLRQTHRRGRIPTGAGDGSSRTSRSKRACLRTLGPETLEAERVVPVRPDLAAISVGSPAFPATLVETTNLARFPCSGGSHHEVRNQNPPGP